jgi:hypothetical protein
MAWVSRSWWVLRFDLASSGEAWDSGQQLCWNVGGHGVGPVRVARYVKQSG